MRLQLRGKRRARDARRDQVHQKHRWGCNLIRIDGHTHSARIRFDRFTSGSLASTRAPPPLQSLPATPRSSARRTSASQSRNSGRNSRMDVHAYIHVFICGILIRFSWPGLPCLSSSQRLHLGRQRRCDGNGPQDGNRRIQLQLHWPNL